MLNYELNIPFRWYLINAGAGNLNNAITAVRKKHRYRFAMNRSLNFELYCRNNTLLPFQVFIPTSERPLTKSSYDIDQWLIVKASVENPSSAMAPGDYYDVIPRLGAVNANLFDFIEKTAVANKGIYITGCKNGENGSTFPFVMDCGYWYSAIRMRDGTWAVSEDFYIPKDQGIFDNKLMRLDWKNSYDTLGVLYQNNFVNRLWLDADFENDDPSIVEEGVRNGLQQFIQQGIQFIDTYVLSDHVPDYIYRAFLHSRACDTVVVWVRGFLYYSYGLFRDVSIKWDESGVEGILTAKFEQRDYNDNQLKYGCGNNFEIGSPIPFVANPDIITLYPYVSQTTFSVLDNDTGFGLKAAVIVGFHDVDNKVSLTLNQNGTVKITSVNNAGFNTADTTIVYTAIDDFGVHKTANLVFRIVNWAPTPDGFVFSVIELYNGRTLWSSTDSAGLNLFDNDSYPANANNVQVVAGTYYSTSGSGNYVVVAADGNWVLHVVNSGYIMSHGTELFNIQYYNTPLGAKYATLLFEWAI